MAFHSEFSTAFLGKKWQQTEMAVEPVRTYDFKNFQGARRQWLTPVNLAT
jgi:hypothetical protein